MSVGGEMDRLRTLIVEDDISIQKLYDRGLPNETFEKQFSKNGVDALSRYELWKPDIIILDIFLPEMTGYSILRKIRKEYGDSDTIIIMSTALKQGEHIWDCIQLGIQGYIVKPFRFKTIGTEVIKCYQSAGKKMTDINEAIRQALY
ncbi:MAG: response regulator [Nitrospiraceae bacterium]|nr:MAG: response regulator [Nitrospiraceae bacterium]